MFPYEMEPLLSAVFLFVSFRLVGLLGDQLLPGQLLGKLHAQHRLRVIVGDGGVAAALLCRFLQNPHQFRKDVPVQRAAPPVEHEGQPLAQGHLGTFAHLLRRGKGALLELIVGVLPVRTGRQGIEGSLVVPEEALVVQVEVVVPEDAVLPQGVVEGGVQVIILSVQLQNVPGVAVFHATLRVCLGDGDHAPDAQGVTEDLHRLGDALAHPHAVGERTDDLVGIGLFQLVVADVGADKIVDAPLLVPDAAVLQGTGQFLHPGGEGLLLVPDLGFFKEVFWQQLHVLCAGGVAVGKAGDIEDLRAVQPQLEEEISKYAPIQPGHGKGGLQGGEPGLHGVIHCLGRFAEAMVVVGLHSRCLRSDVPYHGAVGLDEGQSVQTGGDAVIALGCPLAGGLGVAAEDERHLVVLLAGGQDAVQGSAHLRAVELHGMAQSNGKVEGAHEDAVHAVHGQDLFDVLQAPAGLALWDQQRLPVAAVKVDIGARLGSLVIAPLAVPGRAEAAVAQRREFGVLHQSAHLLHRLHGGDDEALGAVVQGLEDFAAGDVVDPDQRNQSCGVGGGDGGGEEVDAHRGVFRIDEDIVQSGLPQAFHGGSAVELGEGPHGQLLLHEFFLYSIHCRHSLFFPVPLFREP